MTGHEDHQTVSAWATAAHAAARPGARLLYATTTEEFVQAWEPCREQFNIFLTEGLPLRTPASDLAVSLRLEPAAVDRKIVALRAQASQTTALFAALGEERVRQWWSTETFVAADAATPARRSGAPGGWRREHRDAGEGVCRHPSRPGRDTSCPRVRPFGLALGATLAATHIPPLIAWSSSPLVFGGAAQLLAVQLLDTGASVALCAA